LSAENSAENRAGRSDCAETVQATAEKQAEIIVKRESASREQA
jgi:hypothetical protein